MHNLQFIKPFVERVLRDNTTPWSVQGFGMLRTYFGPPSNPKRFRLNLWSSRLAVPNVSTIHDHPWDFESIIVCGGFENQRFKMEWEPPSVFPNPTHAFTTIKTGAGGGMEKSPVQPCVLLPYATEHYFPGDTYAHKADEIHETRYQDNCITLNDRTGDTQHARVFWPWGTEWVDAEPRDVSSEFVYHIVQNTLREHFNG